MLPGRDLIQYFVSQADGYPDGSLFGQCGRQCLNGYSPIEILPRTGESVPVSLVVRGYFVETEYLYTLLRFSRYLPRPITEDDILLSWALRTYTDRLIYLTSRPERPSELMNEQELPAPYACCERPEHHEIRERFWTRCQEISLKIQESLVF